MINRGTVSTWDREVTNFVYTHTFTITDNACRSYDIVSTYPNGDFDGLYVVSLLFSDDEICNFYIFDSFKGSA